MSDSSLARGELLFHENLQSHPRLNWLSTRKRGAFDSLEPTDLPGIVYEPIASIDSVRSIAGPKMVPFRVRLSMLVVGGVKGLGGSNIIDSAPMDRNILNLATDVRAVIWDNFTLGPTGTAGRIVELSEVNYTRTDIDSVSLFAFTASIEVEDRFVSNG